MLKRKGIVAAPNNSIMSGTASAAGAGAGSSGSWEQSGFQPARTSRSGGHSGWQAGRWEAGGWKKDKGGDWKRGRGGGWHGHDWKTADDGGQAAQDGHVRQTAGPPVECVLTGQDLWQADMGDGKWQDVDPTWTEPLFQALRGGQHTLRLPHVYQNKLGEEIRSWYTIECTDTCVTQQNEATGKRRELRVVQMMEPTVVGPPAASPPPTPPPPTELPAVAAGLTEDTRQDST